MIFNDLLDLIGRRSDSPQVVVFAEQHGIKLPLKHTTDTNDTQHSAVKAYGVEISWGHDILHPDFYPPQKENKKYVSYIQTIWFNKRTFDTLPHGLLPQDSFAEALQKLAHLPHSLDVRSHGTRLEFPVAHYPYACVSLSDWGKGKGYITIDDSERYHWLKSDSRAHAFSPWDTRWPNEQADLPIGMFMAWCIQRGWTGEWHTQQHPQLVEAVKQRQLTGREFLYQAAFCDQLWSRDLAPAIKQFASLYLHCLCHRNSSEPLLGDAERCGVDDDFMAVFNPHFANRGLEAADNWANYDRFALFLDARWYDYQKTNLETDVEDAAALADVKAFYLAQQLKMQALPAPIALALQSTANKPAAPALDHTAASTLLSFLGRCAEDDDVKVFLSSYGLSYPTVSWNTYVDAPSLGFFLGLNYPWKFSAERFKTLFDDKEQARIKRKKIKYVEEVTFTQAAYEQVSNSTGNYLLCEAFLAPLPFGLHWELDLQAMDQRYGEDHYEEHTWETYKNDGSLTRRWFLAMNGSLLTGDEGAPHYLLLVEFIKFKMMQVRVLIR